MANVIDLMFIKGIMESRLVIAPRIMGIFRANQSQCGPCSKLVLLCVERVRILCF